MPFGGGRKGRKGESPMEGYGKPVEWPGMGDLKEIAAERRKTRRYTLGWRILIVMGILFGVFSAVAMVKNSNDFYSTTEAVAQQLKLMNEDKPGKQAAMQNVYKWVDGQKGAYPSGVDGYSWDGASKISTKTDEDNGTVTDYWSHTISFIDLSDNSSHSVAQLIKTENGVASAVGQPTILPAKPSSTSNDRSTAPSGYHNIGQNESLTNAINAWGKAYMGKDSNALTVLVADPNSKHAFMPASLGEFRNASINWAVASTQGEVESDDSGERTAPYGAVSVSISFTPYGASKDSNQSVSTNILLLVKDPTKGSARVVDWGADMNIKALKPFSNAVDKNLVSKSSDADSTGSTDGTGSASGTGTDVGDGTDSGDANTNANTDANANADTNTNADTGDASGDASGDAQEGQ